MSSKGVLDSSKKKDTEKKEIKKEKKEKKEKEKREKKEKKEKSKKRDSENLEKDEFGDENQTEENDQGSSSAKTKNKFGIFRLLGMKSKGSKYDSSDSLTVQSRNSIDFDKSGSEFSLHESSGSLESATAETAESSEKIVLDMKKESTTAKLESDVWTGSPSKNINPQSFEIVSRSLPSSVIVTETEQTRAKGDRKEGVKLRLEAENVSPSLTVQSRNSTDFDRSGSDFSLHESSGSLESAAAETAEPSEKIVLDMKKESATAKLESDVWTGSPKNINPQSFEIVSRSLQSSVIVTETDQTRAKGDRKEGVKLRLEAENISPSLTVQSRNSTDFDRSGSEFSLHGSSGSLESATAETAEPSEKNVLDMAKLQSDVRTGSPKNIKAQSLVIERPLQSSAILTEPNQTREKAKDIKKVHDREITRSEEKRIYTVVSTAISNTGYAAGEIREEVETGTPNKERIHNQKGRPGDPLRDEKPVVQAVSKNKKSQLLEQVDKFLKLEANIKGRSKHQSVEKGEVKEKIRSVIEEDDKLPQKGIDLVDDPPEKLAPKSSSFNEKTGFTSSTPKRPSIDNNKNTAKEIKNEEHKKVESAKDNKTSSVVKLKLRAQLLNVVKDVKMSSTVLMAQLKEVNKKLKELKEELLKLLDKGIDEPKKASTEDVSIQS